MNAIHYAAYEGHLNVVQYLVDHGANVDSVNKHNSFYII